MKIKNLLLVVCCLFSMSGVAQVTELGTLQSSDIMYAGNLDVPSFYMHQGNEVKILNNDLSDLKSIDYSTSDANVQVFNVAVLSRHFFNTDDKLEFVVIYVNQSVSPYEYHTILSNEDGDVLYDFGTGVYSAYIVQQKNENILMIQGAGICKTYSLAKHNAPIAIAETTQSSQSSCFPNPADTYVTIPYTVNAYTTLSILTIEGKTIAHYLLDSNKSEVRVDVSSLTPGVYVYHYNQVSKQFIVK